jgi:hypothetical protein
MNEFKKSINFHFIGRNGEIRTHDPLHPIQVRYQTALRPDYLLSIFRISAN